MIEFKKNKCVDFIKYSWSFNWLFIPLLILLIFYLYENKKFKG